jgi:hypothetical protein
MDKKILSKLILDRLIAAGNRDDLIREICLRQGIQWAEAEALVAEVEAENEKTIFRRQSPIALTTSIMFALAGTLITAFAGYSLFWTALEEKRFSLYFILNLVQFGHQMLLVLIIGLALAIGGMIAFFETIFQLREQ